MELRHLRAFSAIAELHSFSKAARQLHVAQPPLSRHIGQLERELGTLLRKTATAIASGGGGKAQAEAVRLGIARALVKYDENLKKTLRPLGYLTRDSRMKERKKPGLKRARRAPQFAKR